MKYQNPWIQKTVLATLIAASPLTALAQGSGRDGHGGEVLACFTHVSTAKSVYQKLIANRRSAVKIDPLNAQALAELADHAHGGGIELIDLYLAKRPDLDGNTEPLIHVKADFKSIANDRIQNLKNTNYVFYQMLAKSQNLLGLKNWAASQAGVVELDDALLAMTFPENCLPLQIANQQILNASVALVNFDERLFKLLSPTGQAALVIHEWVYNTMVRTQNVTDARSTQMITKMIFSERFKPENARDYQIQFKNLGLNPDTVCTTFGVCLYGKNDQQKFLNQTIRSQFKRVEAGEDYGAQILGDSWYRYANPVEFKGFLLSAAYLEKDQETPTEGLTSHPTYNLPLPLSNDGSTLEPYSVRFKPSGDLDSIVLHFKVKWSYQNFNFEPNEEVTLDKNLRAISRSGTKSKPVTQWKGFACESVKYRYEGDSINPSIHVCETDRVVYKGLRLKGEIPVAVNGEMDLSQPITSLEVNFADGSLYHSSNIAMTTATVQKIDDDQYFLRSFRFAWITQTILGVDCTANKDVTLYSNGKMESCYTGSSNRAVVSRFGRNINSKQNALIEFHPNGNVKSFVVSSESRIQGNRIPSGTKVTFDKNERVISIGN